MKSIAVQAAREAGRVLLELAERGFTVRHKGEVDLVTEADRAAEEAIVRVLRGAYPDHDILAEEADHGRRASRWRWVVDPLDGTTNYAHGFPWYAVSIALEIDQQVALGVVYAPSQEQLFLGEVGQGAWCNERPLRVSRTERLDQSLLATGFPYDRKQSPVNNYDHFLHFQEEAQACRRAGAASLDLVHTAAGGFDGYWEMKLKPWDVAAGKVIVEEAGGRVSDFDGHPLDIYGQECLASNGQIHAAMLAVLGRGRRPERTGGRRPGKAGMRLC